MFCIIFHTMFCTMLYRSEKSPKPSKKNKDENKMLILGRAIFGVLDQRLEYDI